MALKAIDILPTAQSAQGYDFSRSVAVVIDVLRATSVITMAIHNRAQAVAPVLSPEEAFQLADKLGRPNVILGGERNADRIPGFDLGNSPQDYAPSAVAGKTIILTTTNGTVALRNATTALALLAASMLNASAAAQAAARLAQDRGAESIALVCSGNYGALTLEDCCCAALIADKLISQDQTLQLASDQAKAIHWLSTARRGNDFWMARQSLHYSKLLQKGYQADAQLCLEQVDTIGSVPAMSPDGRLRPWQGD